MRVIIISRNPGVYATARLVAAALQAGHEALVLDQTDCALAVGSRGPAILYRGERLPAVDVAIPRIGPTATDYGIAVVRQFEAMGVPTLNRAAAIAATKDRLQCLQVLSAAGLPVPQTVLARESCGAQQAIEAAGGPPVVLKLPRSAKGIGVMLGESAVATRALLETFWAIREDVLIQQRITEGVVRETRLVVLDGEVVAAVERTASPNDFRANVHRGAQLRMLEPSEEQRQLAVAATAALGLDVAGVDLVEGAQGAMILEVNSTPGLEGLERATGKNVAQLIVEAALRRTSVL